MLAGKKENITLLTIFFDWSVYVAQAWIIRTMSCPLHAVDEDIWSGLLKLINEPRHSTKIPRKLRDMSDHILSLGKSEQRDQLPHQCTNSAENKTKRMVIIIQPESSASVAYYA